MSDLAATIIQSDLVWEDPKKNLARFTEKISQIKEKTNIILLPELFNTDYTMNAPKFAEKMDGETMQWLYKEATGKQCAVAGCMMIEENKRFFNRLIWMHPDGSYHTYDKRHLFGLAGATDEADVFTAGKKQLKVKLNDWHIQPMICYDLRFPVWCRNPGDIDVQIFLASWPEARIGHWKTLLAARAIENQTYVIGVNRLGKDGNGVKYSGDSMVFSPSGECLFSKSNEEATQTIILSKEFLIKTRETFPVLKDTDEFKFL